MQYLKFARTMRSLSCGFMRAATCSTICVARFASELSMPTRDEMSAYTSMTLEDPPMHPTSARDSWVSSSEGNPEHPGACVGRTSRTQLYCQKIGCDHLGHRFVAWRKVCSSKKIPEGPFCVLPNLFLLEPGNYINFDPGLNCPWMSLRSLIETAKLHRLKAVFSSGHWRLVNHRIE